MPHGVSLPRGKGRDVMGCLHVPRVLMRGATGAHCLGAPPYATPHFGAHIYVNVLHYECSSLAAGGVLFSSGRGAEGRLGHGDMAGQLRPNRAAALPL